MCLDSGKSRRQNVGDLETKLLASSSSFAFPELNEQSTLLRNALNSISANATVHNVHHSEQNYILSRYH